MAVVSLARYLFERLHQQGVDTIFGLPGDFNSSLLDRIYDVPGMKWAGNANELNAAYAADGYSRIKGLACLVTTFGVGELLALNGVSGSYAEHVGLVHVVGVPSIASQARQLLLHHTLGNGDFTVFHRISNNLSQTTAFISDIATAPSEIDRCIRDAYVYQRPVYLGLPTNLAELKVPSSLLDSPIDMSLKPNEPESQQEVVDTVLRLIAACRNPIILVDAGVSRHRCQDIVRQLADVTQFPVYATPMGKSAFTELHPRFGGIYVGSLSQDEVRSLVELADLVLSVGVLLSEFSTLSFTFLHKTKNVIEFHANYTKIQENTFPGIQMKEVLTYIVDRISSSGLHTINPLYKASLVPVPQLTAPSFVQDAILTQEDLWGKVSSWFREGDIIVTETGTSAFGIIQARFPDNTVGISQALWGLVGFAVGATFGAAMASLEVDQSRRVILFVGDGSLQLTVQEILSLCKWECNNTYIFVLNNDGYTIDRLIHGVNATYNDIQPWNNLALLPLFNAKDYETIRITTTGELDNLFQNEAFAYPDKIRMIEVILPRMDGPANIVAHAKFLELIQADDEGLL